MKRIVLVLVAALSATPALADMPTSGNPEADRIASALTHHLNAHGKHFVATEGQRLAIGDASESGAKDDAREACPKPESCLKFKELLDAGDIQGAMLLLAAHRAEQLESRDIARLVHGMEARNSEIKRLNVELEKTTDKGRQTELKSQIEKLNGTSQLDMIQMQSLVNKRNQAFDMMSNLLQKFQQSLNSIIGNMR